MVHFLYHTDEMTFQNDMTRRNEVERVNPNLGDIRYVLFGSGKMKETKLPILILDRNAYFLFLFQHYGGLGGHHLQTLLTVQVL